ncbi:MAG TPA: S8 family serine peptidase, partial [Egibacteraceae bacterium]|nr:S8 family serine peptidase [Egibacteraceae bacterium]
MKKRVRLAAASMAAVLSLPAALPASVTAAAAAATAAVIVQAPGAEARVAAAVRDLGGTVTRALPIVGGFAAVLPEAALPRLAAEPGVTARTPDGRMVPQATKTGDGTNLSTLKSVYREEVGADVLNAAGFTGAGVTIALVDTGIDTEVAGSGDLKGKVLAVDDPMVPPTAAQPDPPDVECVDFSGEDTCDDTFGHGTFMAGLMAGSGAASGGSYKGVAPDARLVSIKVGGRDGSADVSKVLAGIQWAVSFKDRYDIDVLNLSLGSDSVQPPEIDPLNLAVQRAWVSGLTVVVSAGNFGAGPRTRPDGTTYGTVTKPGDDPFVITVGSSDDRETPGIDDNRLPHFSSWGPTFHGLAKPDVIAPGGRVISLRAPGSFIDETIHAGKLDAAHRRGSGTSMSAAVTSGLAALLLDARDGSDGLPEWRPDDVKAALIAGARKIKVNEPRAIGAGQVHGPSALAASISPTYRISVLSDGGGTLDASRGTNRVAVPCPEPILSAEPQPECWQTLEGEQTAQGNNWQETEALGNNWQGNNWQGMEFADSEWTPQSWYESQWVSTVGNNWQGNNWQATTWANGNNWQGNNWQGSTWNGQTDGTSYGQTTRGS